jgi:hypothetical protein
MMTVLTAAGILTGVGIRTVYLFSRDPSRRSRAWQLLTLHQRHR